jgi:hypothetical protein
MENLMSLPESAVREELGETQWFLADSLRVLLYSAVCGVVCALAATSPVTAQSVPVPHATYVPVTANSYPLGAANHLNVPEDLKRVGYVEDEYFVSGTANVYDWTPPNPATVRTANAPYTTRMLIRRPIDSRRFSGNVIVEILNATNLVDFEIGWALSKEQIVHNGDIWIGFTSKPVTAAALQRFNPTRYAPLNWANPLPVTDSQNCTTLSTIIAGDSSRTTEDGLLWDIFSQIAALARSDADDNPLRNYNVKRVYGYGYSQSGFDLQTYIDAVHPLARQRNGKYMFDGFLDVAGFNTPSPINQCSPAPAGTGAAEIHNAGVPVIRMATNSEDVLASVQAARREDSNQYPDQFREYELASAAHATPNELDFGPAYADILAAGAPMPPLTCGFGPRSPYPSGFLQNAALANLEAWVSTGVPPPPGLLLNYGENDVQTLDEYGNATGGVRTPYVDVPTAQWFVGSPSTTSSLCFLLGYVQPFDKTQLEALYGDHEAYVKQVVEDTLRLVARRYLTFADGQYMIRHAQQSSVPAAADIPSDLPDDLYWR